MLLIDCFLKEGQYGFFISLPQKKRKEPWTNPTTGKTHDYENCATILKDGGFQDELTRLVSGLYDSTIDGNYDHITETAPGGTVLAQAKTDTTAAMPV